MISISQPWAIRDIEGSDKLETLYTGGSRVECIEVNCKVANWAPRRRVRGRPWTALCSSSCAARCWRVSAFLACRAARTRGRGRVGATSRAAWRATSPPTAPTTSLKTRIAAAASLSFSPCFPTLFRPSGAPSAVHCPIAALCKSIAR
jgi:hypothetical protein